MKKKSEERVLTTVEISKNHEITSIDGQEYFSNDRRCYRVLFSRNSVCPGCPHRQIIEEKKHRIIDFKPQKELPKFRLKLFPILDENGEVSDIKERISIPDSEPIKYFQKDLIDRLSDSLLKSKEFPIEKKLFIATLRRCVESQNLILSQVAHQIQHPLSIARGYIELFFKSPSEEYQKVIDQELVNLMELTNKILKFAQIEFGMVKLDLKRVEVVSFLRKIYQRFERDNESHEFNFLVPEGKRYFIKIDQKEFEDVIRIFLENAFKYVPKGKQIELGIKNRKDGVFIYVSDNGEGMDHERKEKIFDPFFRGSASSHGTGLGLWIAKNIVRQHGGDIWVESRKGNGAKFCVRIALEKKN